MKDVEKIAKQLIDGTIECNSCPALTDLVEQVRRGELSFEDFKKTISNSLKELEKVS